jgi:hypothetical protein
VEPLRGRNRLILQGNLSLLHGFVFEIVHMLSSRYYDSTFRLLLLLIVLNTHCFTYYLNQFSVGSGSLGQNLALRAFKGLPFMLRTILQVVDFLCSSKITYNHTAGLVHSLISFTRASAASPI